jgi:hypothetical protein
MNEIKKKLDSDKHALINRWLGVAMAYRDASRDASYFHQHLSDSFRREMRFWSKTVAKEIKETK